MNEIGEIRTTENREKRIHAENGSSNNKDEVSNAREFQCYVVRVVAWSSG